MKSKNPLIKLITKIYEGEISFEEAVEKLASIYIFKENIKDAIFYLKELREKSTSQALNSSFLLLEASEITKRLRGESRFLLAGTLQENQKFPEAKKIYKEAKSIFQKKAQWIYAARCDRGIANIYSDLENFEKAAVLYDDARSIFEENNQWIDVAKCELNKANVYRDLEKFDEAIKLYDRAKDTLKKNKQWIDMAKCISGKSQDLLCFREI